MRRVTIQEAARCLDVHEDVIKTRVKDGSLVACQDPEHLGYVWLRDAPQLPPEANTGSKTHGGARKTRAIQQARETQSAPTGGQVNTQDVAPPPEAQSGKGKSRTGKRPREAGSLSSGPEVEAQEAGTVPKAPSREGKSRSTQRSQEVELLRESVAMLREELGNRDRQLELKDAEIQARRDEVKELLALLHQSRALPAAQGPRKEGRESIITSIQVAYILAVERLISVSRELASHGSRLVFRNKSRKSAGERS